MESESSLPCTEGHSTGFYPEHDKPPFPYITFPVPNVCASIISPSSRKPPKLPNRFRFPTKISYPIHISPKALLHLPSNILPFLLSS